VVEQVLGFYVLLIGILNPLSTTRFYLQCSSQPVCNYSSHLATASAMTFSLDNVGVKTGTSAALIAAFFLGREVRDRIKWKGQYDLRDGALDFVSGAAGAALVYLIKRRR
jgi:hypothetical protein